MARTIHRSDSVTAERVDLAETGMTGKVLARERGD